MRVLVIAVSTIRACPKRRLDPAHFVDGECLCGPKCGERLAEAAELRVRNQALRAEITTNNARITQPHEGL